MDADPDPEHHARLTTARSRELGQELHLARKRAKLTATTVAEELGWSPGKLSKMEHGWRATSSWDYGTLLGKLGADRQTRERIQRIASEQDIGLFVRSFDERISDHLMCLSIHERAARTMQKYEPMIIPGLLQTESYARAVMSTFVSLTVEELDMFAATRMERQTVLKGEQSPDTTCYIHEAALKTVMGSYRVMHDQMMRLVFMCGWRRLRPRVIPMAAGGHWALSCGYNLMTFSRSISPVAYSENDVSGVFAEQERAVQRFQAKSKALAALALDVDRSRKVFSRWADFYDRRAEGPDLAEER